MRVPFHSHTFDFPYERNEFGMIAMFAVLVAVVFAFTVKSCHMYYELFTVQQRTSR